MVSKKIEKLVFYTVTVENNRFWSQPTVSASKGIHRADVSVGLRFSGS